MKMKVEQCKLLQGLSFATAFCGKGKDDATETCVKIEIININPATAKITCYRDSVLATAEVELLYANEVGTFPLVNAGAFRKFINTLEITDEIDISDYEVNSEGVKGVQLDSTGRAEPIFFLNEDNLTKPMPTINMSNAKIYNLEGNVLINGVRSVNNLIKKTENLVFNCVNMILTPDAVLFEGLDMSSNTIINNIMASTNKQSIKVFFDSEKAMIGFKSFDPTLPVKIELTNNTVAFSQNGLSMYIQLYVGNFVATYSFFPSQFVYKFSFDKFSLMRALDRINIFIPSKATMRTCEIEFSNIFTKVKSLNTRGKIVEQFTSIASTPEKVSKVFNLDSLEKALKQMPNGKVEAIIYENGYVNFQHQSNADIIRCLVPPLSREVKQNAEGGVKPKKKAQNKKTEDEEQSNEEVA